MLDDLNDVPVIYVARSLRSSYVAVSADEREIRYLLDIAPGIGEPPIRRVDVPALLANQRRMGRLAVAGRDGQMDIVEAVCLIADLAAGEDVESYADAALAALEGRPDA